MPKPTDSQIANTPNGPIEYRLLGSGPVVLACHGTSSDCFSTEGTAPLLASGFSILTPSRPGYGRTPVQTGQTAAQAADAMAALLDCLGIPSCGVLAISGGGPTGVALAANHPKRVQRLALMAALTRTEGRANEPAYQSQKAFYGPMHEVTWGMLRLMSDLSPRNMARQTMAIFSTNDPADSLNRLQPDDIESIRRFYHGRSSRKGALNDLTHSLDAGMLRQVRAPVLVIHSRMDASVPFTHAEWSLQHIADAQLCEGGFTGHFLWIGPDSPAISRRLVGFFRAVEPD